MSAPVTKLDRSDGSSRSVVAWVLVPAVVMSLGWGLRGYIGGGPYGAMIPGALVSLMLCRFLKLRAEAAAMVVAFGTIGIGCGGNMTYGQTLGLIRLDDSFWWGLAGTTTKGAVWGLLGGALMGLGLAARSMSWRHLLLALVVVLIGMALGIELVNVPRVVYFSDPINKPRDESWAGILLAAALLLVYVRCVNAGAFRPMAILACYGAIGGGLGFGIGSLFLALQPQMSDAWRWLPFWKFMEFTFGFVLGGSLGLGARQIRNDVESHTGYTVEREHGIEPGAMLTGLVGGAATVSFVFLLWPQAILWAFPQLHELARSSPLMTLADVLTDFPGLGCVMLLISRRWSVVAWQLAISVTIVAAAIDWQRDLLPRGDIDIPASYRTIFILIVAALSIGFVQRWHQKRPLEPITLFLFALCVLMGIGYLMGLSMSGIWWPNQEAIGSAGGRTALLWQTFRSEIVVHVIFTTLFVLSLCFGLREYHDSADFSHLP